MFDSFNKITIQYNIQTQKKKVLKGKHSKIQKPCTSTRDNFFPTSVISPQFPTLLNPSSHVSFFLSFLNCESNYPTNSSSFFLQFRLSTNYKVYLSLLLPRHL